MYSAEPGRTDWDMRQSCCAKAVLDILYSTSIYSTLYCTVALNWSWVCGSAEAQLPDGGFHRYFPLKYWIYSVKYFGNFWVRGSRLESGISHNEPCRWLQDHWWRIMKKSSGYKEKTKNGKTPRCDQQSVWTGAPIDHPKTGYQWGVNDCGKWPDQTNTLLENLTYKL